MKSDKNNVKSVKAMTDREILAVLVPFLADRLGLDECEVVTTANLYDDLACDRLDFFEILIALDEEFHFYIPRDVEKQIQTVGDIIYFIRKYN